MIEPTLIMIKPDGIQRRLTGEIISRFEKKGLKLVAAKLMRLSPSLAQRHYEIHRGKDYFDRSVNHILSGPVLVMVLEGLKVIEITRKLMGATFGCDADAGTIRGDYAIERLNIIHGADSIESAEREISLYFTPDEILDYQMPDENWLK